MIQMTRQQYQQKYGVTPAVPKPTSQPIQMTRQQYQERYGQQPSVPSKPKTLGGFAENIVKSGGRMVKDMASAAANTLNPNPDKNTAVNLIRLGQGIGQKLDPTEGNKIANISNKLSLMPWLNPKNTNYESYADNTIDFYKNRYGGVENIKNTLYNDPVGVAADVATVALPAGKALQGAGAATKTAGLTKAGTTLIKAGEMIDPVTGTTKVLGKASSPVLNIVTKTTGLNEDIALRGLGNPAKQAKLRGKYGYESPTQYMDKYNLYGRDPEVLQGVMGDLKSQYDDLALRSGNQVDVSKILNEINNEMMRIETSPAKYSKANQAKLSELLNRRNQILEAFGAGETDVANVTQFRRQAIDPDIPQSTFGLDTEPLGRSGGSKATRDILKKAINETDPKLKELGEDISYGIDLKPIFEGYQNRAKNRQVLNFSRLGSAGLGGFFGGIQGALAGFTTEQIVNNPQVLAYLSKMGKKTKPAKTLFKRSAKPLKDGYEINRALWFGSRGLE